MSTAATRDLAELRQALQRPGALPAHTVYECPDCAERFVGRRRCDDCGVFCRRVGPGGSCPHCGDPVALGDLLPTL